MWRDTDSNRNHVPSGPGTAIGVGFTVLDGFATRRIGFEKRTGTIDALDDLP